MEHLSELLIQFIVMIVCFMLGMIVEHFWHPFDRALLNLARRPAVQRFLVTCGLL